MYTIILPGREETKENYSEAWKFAKEKAMDLAEEMSERDECYIGISFEKNNNSITLHNVCKDQFFTICLKENP